MLLENDEMIIDIEGIIVNMKVERLKTHNNTKMSTGIINTTTTANHVYQNNYNFNPHERKK